MKPKGKKSRLLIYLALAVLVTSLATSATLAKYSSTFSATATMQIAAFAGGGGAASFDVTMEDMAPGRSSAVQFTVQNYDEGENGLDCEVQMDYEIQVETTGNLPLVFSLRGQKESDDSSAKSVLTGQLDPGTLKAVGGKLPVASANTAAGGRKKHTYELTVAWPEGETDEDYSQEIDMVTITVTAKQADPGKSD